MWKGKRAFDLLAAGGALLLLSPIFLVVALLIKLDDGGLVFFRQIRVGHRGRPFRIWKFRTMAVDADRRGLALTVGRDPRVTPLGHWLRRFKLDELPQFFNVITAQMSLVGPRPEVPRYVDLYDGEERQILELMPGIFPPAWIAIPNEHELLAQAEDSERYYVEQIMPRKIRLNLDYARSASLVNDLLLIFKTIYAIPRT